MNEDEQRAKLESWIADGDSWIGVFENHDLGHHRIGERVAFQFALSDGSFDGTEIGKTRAPDSPTIGFGWRYILVAKCKEAAPALYELRHNLPKEATH